MDASLTRWWWIRHAPIAPPNTGRVNGQSDVDVDVSDRGAFAALARQLPTAALWAVSSLSRTAKTAEALFDAGATRHPLSVQPGLAEQDFGDWTGRTWTEIGSDATTEAFWKNPAHGTPPNGESFASQVARTSAVMMELTAENPGRDIVAVAHAGTIRAALAVALDVDPSVAMAFKISPISLTRMDHIAGTKPGWRGGAWAIGGVNGGGHP